MTRPRETTRDRTPDVYDGGNGACALRQRKFEPEDVAHESFLTNMALSPDCPVCQQNGLQGKLRRFHINFEESITLCANEKCTYPLGLVKTNDLIRKPQSLKKSVNGKRDVSNGNNYRDSSRDGSTANSLSPRSGKPGPPITAPKVFGGYNPGMSQKNTVRVTLAEVDQCQTRTPQVPVQSSTNVPPACHTADSRHNTTPVTATNLPKGNDTQIKVVLRKPQRLEKSSILSVKLDGNQRANSCNGQKLDGNQRANSGTGQKLDGNQRANSGTGQKLDGNQRANSCNGQKLDGNQKTNSGSAQKLTLHGNSCSQLNDLEEEDVDVLSKWYLQWENRDALCWLDVVLCLLVQSRSVKTAVERSLNTSSGTEPGSGKTYIVRTLLAAYNQAMSLSKSLCAEREMLKIVPKSEGGENRSGDRAQDRWGQQQATLAKATVGKNEGMLLSSHTGTSNGGVPLKMGAGQIHSPSLASWTEIMVADPGFLKARSILDGVREQVWQGLQPKLQCEKGRKDSPVFAIPLLLHSDSDICHLFETTYKFETKCSWCGGIKIERYTKVLPTLPKVVEDFSMYNVSHWRDCFFCSAPNQKRQLHFEKLSQCVMIHFVEGLPSSDLTALHFSLRGQSYQVASVVQYKSDPSHFVIWIKHPSGNFWMECDDLNGPLSKFEGQPPNIPAGQIHVVFWERTSPAVEAEIDEQPPAVRQNLPVKSRLLRSRKKSAVLESSSEISRKKAAILESVEAISGKKEANMEGSVTKKPVPVEPREGNSQQDSPSTAAAKAVPPVAVRKTFALLKQMKSSKTPAASSAYASWSTSRGDARKPCGREPTVPGARLSNAPFVLPQGNPPLLAAPPASGSQKTAARANAQVFEGYKSKANAQVFEGYNSKAIFCTQKMTKNEKGEQKELITSRTSGSTFCSEKPSQSIKLPSSPTTNSASQTSAVKSSSVVSKNPMLKRKGTAPLLPQKKLRSSCHSKEAEATSLNRFAQRCVDSRSANPIAGQALLSNKQLVETPKTENLQNSVISDPNADQSIEDLVLPDWADIPDEQSKRDLSDLLSNALPELSEFLSEDYKGDNSSSTAQTEILQDLYKALDLNVGTNSSDATQVFESTYIPPEGECSIDPGDLTDLLRPTYSPPDECSPIDALLSL